MNCEIDQRTGRQMHAHCYDCTAMALEWARERLAALEAVLVAARNVNERWRKGYPVKESAKEQQALYLMLCSYYEALSQDAGKEK